MSAAENLPSLHSRARSFACLSDTTTDIEDEFFDAFDDEDVENNISDRTVTNTFDEHFDAKSSSPSQLGLLAMSEGNMFTDGMHVNSNTTFHTARDQNTRSEPEVNNVTINESISTLSPDDEDNKTLASIELDLPR